jgi:hypothetical protein
MEALIRELEALSQKPDVPNSKLVGAVIATAVRFREILDARMLGFQALAAAVAMQPEIDPRKLHEDFLTLLGAQYESARDIPRELRDIASAIKLASADGR